MSREKVELVRRAYAQADPLTGLAANAVDDVVVDLTALYPDQPVLRGIDEVRRFRDSSPWGTSQRFEAERYFDVDHERVLVFVQATATGQGSGAPVEVRPAHELTIRDGLLVRFKVYVDRAEALEAAGLSEQDAHTDSP
jgi:ketosteroid isomerase-like protein